MSWTEIVFGRPLRSEEQEGQKIGPGRGIPVLGLDALASAAYGPEAALTVLIVLGGASARYVGPISAIVIGVLVIVYLSYRQTVGAYPNGGGAYTVASENLGPMPALLAASALTVDYILNAAVAISAGVGAIVSAVPGLLPYTLFLCLVILVALTLVNLRGVREAGLLFMFPTYAFLIMLGGVVLFGVLHAVAAGGHPTPVVRPPTPPRAAGSITGFTFAWVLIRAFASGCTAMTGVEAVSNGVPLFREPVTTEARHTLGSIIGALVALLAGLAWLIWVYGIAATPPAQTGYRSVISQVTAAVTGTGIAYYLTMFSTVAVLCLSANTSFADCPRLWRVLALDGYLPAEFSHPGRRLVYSAGIITLAVIAGALLVVFGGITDRLIPLFAVGAFLTFTMSQAGMVMHWRRKGGRGSMPALVMNAVGAIATAATLLVIVASKFIEGAWITVIIVPGLVLLFRQLRTHDEHIERLTCVEGPMQIDAPSPPIVVVPIKRLDRVARKALRLAVSISPDVQVVQVSTQELDLENLRRHWAELVERPLTEAGFHKPELVLLRSPYRDFFGPLLTHVRHLAKVSPRRYIAVVVPELIEARWYQLLLHGHRPTLLKALLLLRGGPRIVVMNTPWYIEEKDEQTAHENRTPESQRPASGPEAAA